MWIHGKAHSNAYRQVNHFFPIPQMPVLKTVRAQLSDGGVFASNWGYTICTRSPDRFTLLH